MDKGEASVEIVECADATLIAAFLCTLVSSALPFVLILSAQFGILYSRINWTAQEIILLFLVVARLMFGNILLMLRTTFIGLIAVVYACCVNFSFASINIPRYLMDFLVGTCSPP